MILLSGRGLQSEEFVKESPLENSSGIVTVLRSATAPLHSLDVTLLLEFLKAL